MEIGSIYEINPDTVSKAGDKELSALRLGEVEKYGRKYVRYTASGREAIALALKSLEENRPPQAKRCLLPAYMCDSVFFPFQRAGWEIHFYHIKEDLTVDEEGLCSQIEHIRPGLLFIHSYYGVDTWKPMRPLFPKWRRLGICIMEDVAQSYYLKDGGRGADYVVGSLRKWYPIPDGGFVASDALLAGEELPEHGEFTSAKLEILTRKWEYLYGAGSPEEKKKIKAGYLGGNRKLEEELDEFEGIRRMSAVSSHLLMRTREEECRHRREENYIILYHSLQEKNSLRAVFPYCKQTAPLYFAVYVRERERLQDYLRERNIFAPVLWLVGEANKDCLTEAEGYIYGHLLALPLDQRYGKEEMHYIVRVLDEYEESVRRPTVLG